MDKEEHAVIIIYNSIHIIHYFGNKETPGEMKGDHHGNLTELHVNRIKIAKNSRILQKCSHHFHLLKANKLGWRINSLMTQSKKIPNTLKMCYLTLHG